MTPEAPAIPDATLPQLLLDRASRSAPAVAMRYKDRGIWKPITWSEYRTRVENFALGLLEIGVVPGSNLCILGDNSPEHLIADMAIQSLGGAGVVLFPESSAEEASFILGHSDSAVVVVRDEEQADKIFDIFSSLPQLLRVICCDMRGMGNHDSDKVVSFASIEEIGAQRAARSPEEFLEFVNRGDASDVAILMYTSGTTGTPKGAMMTHRNVVAAIVNFFSVETMEEYFERLVFLPLAWAGERYFSTAGHFLAGYRLNFAESPETLRADIREIGPHQILGAPRMWEDYLSFVEVRVAEATWLKRNIYHWAMKVGRRQADRVYHQQRTPATDRVRLILANVLILRPVRDHLGLLRAERVYSGGAALGPDVLRYFHALGINLKQVYGQTEVGITTVHWDRIKPETMGRPVPGVEVVITDRREIAHRGESVFMGYYKNPEAAAEALTDDGLLYSGDEGYLDDEGHLVVVDRTKNVATLISGERFSPTFIENKAKFSPYISEAVCFGNARNRVTMLVNIDADVVGKWAEARRIPYTTYTDLSQRPQVVELVRDEIDRINTEMPEFMAIQRFAILHKELDADDEEVTRTRKVRRNVVEDRYSFIIDGLYSDRTEVEVDAEVTYRDGRRAQIRTTLSLVDASILNPVSEEVAQ